MDALVFNTWRIILLRCTVKIYAAFWKVSATQSIEISYDIVELKQSLNFRVLWLFLNTNVLFSAENQACHRGAQVKAENNTARCRVKDKETSHEASVEASPTQQRKPSEGRRTEQVGSRSEIPNGWAVVMFF